METSAHLGRERTCGETEPASSSWAEPESYPTRGSRRPIYFDRLLRMRRTKFHSSSSTFTFFPGHRLSPMRIPNSGHETFDIKCGRVHPWPGHVHSRLFRRARPSLNSSVLRRKLSKLCWNAHARSNTRVCLCMRTVNAPVRRIRHIDISSCL